MQVLNHMPKLNQAGVLHLLIPVIILILGLIAGVYLVTSGSPLKLFSKASVSKPVGPETSFTLVGPAQCGNPLLCLLGRPYLEEDFAVKLYARSDIEEANLFTAKISFPKDLVKVREIKKEGSFIKSWIEEYYDNDTGEISLSGAVPAPGFKTRVGGESALMAVIYFDAKSKGRGVVSFPPDSSSAILSNLNNINILTITRGYEIVIEGKRPPSVSAPVTPSPVATPKATTPLVNTSKGDGNKDGRVNLIDMSIIQTDWMKKKEQPSFRQGIDMNDDGIINTFDFGLHRNLLLKLKVIKGR